jgi:DNA end-binding protein Ku
MARAIWSGSISFGLVNVPVKVYPAVRQHDIHFTQLDPKGNRIRYKRVSEKSGREVEYDDIKKGYEVGKGSYVMIEPDELQSAKPEATSTIDISDFVDLEEIDPIYYEHTYYLAPATKDKGTVKAYALLLRALEQQDKVGIGTVVIRTKQYLAGIRAKDKALVMSTMLFPDEVVSVDDVSDLPDRLPPVTERELTLAAQVIDALASKWDPERYRDTYRAQVLELIKKKADGKEIVVEEPEKQEAKVVDLMAALEASLQAAKKRPAGKASKATKAASTRRTKTKRRKSA